MCIVHVRRSGFRNWQSALISARAFASASVSRTTAGSGMGGITFVTVKHHLQGAAVDDRQRRKASA
jgi:hypothetical protein